MSREGRSKDKGPGFRALALVLLCLALPGCLSLHREPSQPGRTTVGKTAVVIPATLYGSFMVIEAKWDKYGPYHFLVDTGSSATLLTPELIGRYREDIPGLEDQPEVRVLSATGQVTVLPPASVKKIQLGSVVFDDVPVLSYDCAALSAALGIKVDGILGFPLFRHTLLTLDYPRSQLILQSAAGPQRLLPGITLPFDITRKVPIVELRLSERPLTALIDSGSDAMLSVNPQGVDPVFASGPREGPTVATLSGDQPAKVGRLGEDLMIGAYPVPRPIARLSDDLSSVGGGILRHFTVTFDQERTQVAFKRDVAAALSLPPLRGSGMSFSKLPVYWKVVGIVPDSPADAADIQKGDLVTRINGEPVSQWSYRRFDDLVRDTDGATFTFLYGTAETTKRIAFVDLVP